MLDILDSARRFTHRVSHKQTNSEKKAIAEYLRISGDVSQPEQLFLDETYTEQVQAVSKVEDLANEKIGTIISIRV